jgi:hypothetical protein
MVFRCLLLNVCAATTANLSAVLADLPDGALASLPTYVVQPLLERWAMPGSLYNAHLVFEVGHSIKGESTNGSLAVSGEEGHAASP